VHRPNTTSVCPTAPAYWWLSADDPLGYGALPHLRHLSDFLKALRSMASACYIVRSPSTTIPDHPTHQLTDQITLTSMRLPEERLRANFRRRYKWAFKADYQDIDTPDPVAPSFDDFLRAAAANSLSVDSASATHLLSAARDQLMVLNNRLAAEHRPIHRSEFCEARCQSLHIFLPFPLIRLRPLLSCSRDCRASAGVFSMSRSRPMGHTDWTGVCSPIRGFRLHLYRSLSICFYITRNVLD
jgi:hypothetical protein